MRKTLYVLNVEDYAPTITALTYPLLRYYAARIEAEFYIIGHRKFPDWPVTFEKFQIYELAQARGDDFALYIDSDALIHPETPNWAEFLPRNTVAHHGCDQASIRWRYDHYFRRDGRNIGSCNWYTMAWSDCFDLWRPLDDLTLEQALRNIRPTVNEQRCAITPEHLIDDYVCSRNIAKFSLKFITLIDLLPQIGIHASAFSHHLYTEPIEVKVQKMLEVLETHKRQRTDERGDPLFYDAAKTEPIMEEIRGWDLPDRIRSYGT